MERPTKRARRKVLDTEVQKVRDLDGFELKDMPDAEVFYVPDFISKEVASEWYTGLIDLESWYRPKLKVYGKEVTQSRKIAAYATEPKLTLKYSGQLVNMYYEYPPLLRHIQNEVEKKLGVKFNHVMLNLYEDGQIYIGNHRDNIENRVIASVSLGAPRTFIMTHNSAKPARASAPKARATRKKGAGGAPDDDDVPSDPLPIPKKRWTLDSGSLVVMQGDTQKYWKHEIPKEPKVKEGRISLTFRQLVF
ncbi:hypothetical protein BDZ94DRAFT_1230930 [Collybia nuda]|uniref:Fe2OG dioxygenase domain-containing protein n=1 Tax=Collybia nuda TaxID=64659 RepID=A0A9P5XPV7_9AGAR|nr:hypothetical protein BDZ94DRAFT_1230930 [Collybia nuda]